MDMFLVFSLAIAVVTSLMIVAIVFVTVKLRHGSRHQKETDEYINIDTSMDATAVTSCVTTEYVQYPHKQPLERYGIKVYST